MAQIEVPQTLTARDVIQVLFSIALGVLTTYFGARLVLFQSSHFGREDDRVSILLGLLTFLLLSVGIGFWRFVNPWFYATSLAVAFPFLSIALGSARSSDFGGGFIVYVTAFLGLLAGGATLAVTVPLRLITFPAWLPLALVFAGISLALGTAAWGNHLNFLRYQQIVHQLQAIRKAELGFAESNPGHAFTCNGPDLKGLGPIAWEDTLFPLPYRRWGQTTQNKPAAWIGSYGVELKCPVGSPDQLSIEAFSTFGGDRITVQPNGVLILSNTNSKGIRKVTHTERLP